VRDDISGESVGQPHVEQNQIRLFAPAQLDGLGTGRGVSHELEVARELQLRGNTVPDNGVVVDDADAKTSRTGRGHSGSSARHVVPPSGSDLTLSAPPSRPSASAATVKPTPGVCSAVVTRVRMTVPPGRSHGIRSSSSDTTRKGSGSTMSQPSNGWVLSSRR
jgi:hypothetical protein